MQPWTPLSPSAPERVGLGFAAGMTDTGTVRRTNEDKFLIEGDLGLLAVADGMGGHADGEVASGAALGALAHFLRASVTDDGDATVPNFKASHFDPSQADPDATWTDGDMRAMIALHDAVEYANRRVYNANLASGRSDGGGMGTTLTGMWQPVAGGPLFVFHVGDSRLYRLRGGVLTQLTRDQTMYQQALDAGYESNLPPRNLLLQALGPSPDIVPELLTQAMAPGDLYLLCSDGLHGACTDARIAALLARVTPESLASTCADLIEMAKLDGSRDNITAVLMLCHR